MNLLVIGAGYFSQRAHIPTLINNRRVKKIFIFDERKKLSKLAVKKFKIVEIKSITKKLLHKNNIKHVVLAFNREKSFFYAKKIISMGINLLAEKPAAYSSSNLKKLIFLSIKKKVTFKICYQKTYFNSVLYLKKNLKFLKKKYGRILQINFELFNGNMRNNKKSYFRTKEKLSPDKREIIEKRIKPKFLINYKIFLNRYIHSINLFNFLFNLKNIKIDQFKILSKYNYFINLVNKDTNISFFFGDYNFNKWHDKITIFLEKAKIQISLKAPLDFSNSILQIYDGIKKEEKNIILKKQNVFVDQLDEFLNKTSIRKKLRKDFKLYLNDFKLVDSLWGLYKK